MNKILFLIILNLAFFAKAKNNDSLQIQNLNSKVELLENSVKEIRRDELNYNIEKNLLKETYANNYERINQVITIILGIIGFLGYLGLRDINSVKKEYNAELERLRGLKSELEQKINAISSTQIKYEKEISEIIKQNDEQNKKIKLLELENIVRKLRVEKKLPSALEECNKALQIDSQNTTFLVQKGLIYTESKSYLEAINTYNKILEIEPKNEDAVMNIAEVYLFLNREKDSDKIIEENSLTFQDKNGLEALNLFKVVKLINKKDFEELEKEVINQISNLEPFYNWNLNEVRSYFNTLKLDVKPRKLFNAYLNYFDKKINREAALDFIK